MKKFTEIDTWVFDLDNTLYPRHCDLFSQIDISMTGYVSELTGLDRVEARKLQKDLYRDHGTTLRGLMKTRGVDPHEFLSIVHDIDYSILPDSPQLAEQLAALPGRRVIYTNGSVEHAEKTLKAMGIPITLFEGIFDIVESGFVPKPHPSPFEKFMKAHAIVGARSAMFEDLPRNLLPAKQSGMETVLIKPQASAKYTAEKWEHEDTFGEHIDHHTDDLEGFLARILAQIA